MQLALGNWTPHITFVFFADSINGVSSSGFNKGDCLLTCFALFTVICNFKRIFYILNIVQAEFLHSSFCSFLFLFTQLLNSISVNGHTVGLQLKRYFFKQQRNGQWKMSFSLWCTVPARFAGTIFEDIIHFSCFCNLNISIPIGATSETFYQ